MEERIRSVEGCRFVDEVVPNAPLNITREWIDQNKIDAFQETLSTFEVLEMVRTGTIALVKGATAT